MRRGGITGVLLLQLTGAAEAQQAKTPPAQTPPKQVPQWLVQCDGSGPALDCRVSQTLFVQQTGRRLLAVIVRRPSKNEQPALMLQLPHGLFLPSGASLQIDKEKAAAIAVQTCDDKGCYTGSPITPEMLAAMQKGTTLTVGFEDLQKRTINVTVPLAGFAAAYQKLP